MFSSVVTAVTSVTSTSLSAATVEVLFGSLLLEQFSMQTNADKQIRVLIILPIKFYGLTEFYLETLVSQLELYLQSHFDDGQDFYYLIYFRYIYTFSIYSIASKVYESLTKNMFFSHTNKTREIYCSLFYTKPSFWGIYGYVIGRIISVLGRCFCSRLGNCVDFAGSENGVFGMGMID